MKLFGVGTIQQRSQKNEFLGSKSSLLFISSKAGTLKQPELNTTECELLVLIFAFNLLKNIPQLLLMPLLRLLELFHSLNPPESRIIYLKF